MSLTFKTNHVTEGISYLLEQFKGLTNWPKVLTAFLDQIQDLEDMFADLINITNVDESEGDQQDVIGKIVGEERQGRSDANYTPFLKGRTLVNTSEGTSEDIIELLTVLNTDTVVEFIRLPPAGYRAYMLSAVTSEDIAEQYAVMMKEATLAGVWGQLLHSADIAADRFQFDTAGQGLDEGKMIGVF